jgi:RHS repeat-associated protein
LEDSTTTYAYDPLGRVLAGAINEVTNSVTYDVLGRVATVSNVLGGFTNSFVDATTRLSTMMYPNGQMMTNTYFGNVGDQRLQEIWNQNSSSATISKFDYTYNAVGGITAWTQQVDNTTTNVYNLTYDRGDQLLGATLQNTVTLAELANYYYAYDTAGNRTSEQINSNVTQAAANDLNQITSLSGGGALRFRGSVNETSTVTVAGQAVSVVWTNLANSNTLFDAAASVSSGVNTIQVIATDYSLNARTNNYQITVGSQAARTLQYDLDGNLTNITDGTINTNYQWDAANRLVGITAINGTTTNLSAFTYDGLSRRVRITELSGITTNSDNWFVWCGAELCEERDTTGTNVTKRFLAQGEQIGGTNYFFSRDQLSSIREMTDGSGTIRGRYSYDPYGRRSANEVSVSLVEADFGFTGQYFHTPSGLHLALYRAYSADLGRWLSRDPIGENGGSDLYAYVRSNPSRYSDILGLDPISIGSSAEQIAEAVVDSRGASAAEFAEAATADAAEALVVNAGLYFAGGYAAGRLVDKSTGGMLSDWYAGTFQPLTDALYGANEGSSASAPSCPKQRPDKEKCKRAIKILTAYKRLANDHGKSIPPNRMSFLNDLRDSEQIRVTDIPSGLTQDFPEEFRGMTLEQIRKKCGMEKKK